MDTNIKAENKSETDEERKKDNDERARKTKNKGTKLQNLKKKITPKIKVNPSKGV